MHKTHIEFGPYYSEGYLQDVKKSMITLARYKFASKMLEELGYKVEPKYNA